MYNTDDLGFSRLLTKESIFQDISEGQAVAVQSGLSNYFSDAVSPELIKSGELAGNLNVVQGFLQSSNFASGVTGWKFDAVGNLEANTGTFRGSLYASTGLIGDWVIDSTGIYYDGSGTPSIRTSETVEAGGDGVILDADGIRVYSAGLGQVINLPSDGSAPSFASGVIERTTFEIDTQAVMRTSDTVGDGSADSAGVLINNSGVYACEANQNLADANVRILKTGDAFFKGTIDASQINSSEINSADINGSVITGGLLRTASTGQRVEVDSSGITLLSGELTGTYGSFQYGDGTKYGTGALAYINNSILKVPFYIKDEQTVADFHFYNRSAIPTGVAEVGDVCVVQGKLKICTTAGTPGQWENVGSQLADSSISPSISPSVSPSVSVSLSPSLSPSISPSSSPSVSPSISPSPS